VIQYLTIVQIDKFHQLALERFGGQAGTRNYAALKLACEAPINVAHHENGDLFEQAAAYAFSIVRSRPYYDGNRRTGLMAALVFLGLNGYANHKYYEPLLQEAIVYLADQKLTQSEFAQYLRQAYDGTQGAWGSADKG
jgi:death-on-curing protein